MNIPPISKPYKPIVIAAVKIIKQYQVQEPSLPEKIDAICLKLAETEEGPLRLLIDPHGIQYGAVPGRKRSGKGEQVFSLTT